MPRPAWAPSSTLPPLYAEWMASVLAGPIPAETDATCQECAMCAGPRDDPGAGTFFSPDTKCCTYMPALPGFLVGRILRDDDPALAAGRATVEARLAARVAVSPLGLGPPRSTRCSMTRPPRTRSAGPAPCAVPTISTSRVAAAASGASATGCARRGSASTCGARSGSGSGGRSRDS